MPTALQKHNPNPKGATEVRAYRNPHLATGRQACSCCTSGSCPSVSSAPSSLGTLRPFGSPGKPFELFRDIDGTFYGDILQTLGTLLG